MPQHAPVLDPDHDIVIKGHGGHGHVNYLAVLTECSSSEDIPAKSFQGLLLSGEIPLTRLVIWQCLSMFFFKVGHL